MSYGVLTGDKEGGAGFRMSGALYLLPPTPLSGVDMDNFYLFLHSSFRSLENVKL
jgi:hypothetical protein